MRKSLFYIVSYSLLIIISPTVFAGWPMFNVLSPQQIMSDLVVTNDCPSGEGFIPENTKVKIYNYYIPHNETWYWLYTGNTQCQKLPSDLQYIAFHQTGHYTGDLINTWYGTEHNKMFRFTFIIPQPYWYCGYLAGTNPPNTIACAQDQ